MWSQKGDIIMYQIEKSINKLEYLIEHNEVLTKKFIKDYIKHFIHDYDLYDSLEQIHFNNKRCFYDEEHKRIVINPSFTHQTERNILKKSNEKEKIFIYNLCSLFIINHELGHVIQMHNKKNNIYDDEFFKTELHKSEDICELDITELNRKNYNKFHDFFLFETNANMIALLQNEEILKRLSDKLPKELYNEFAAAMITTIYRNDIYPIDFSNRDYNRIVKELQENNKEKYSTLESSQLPKLEIPNDSLKELLLKGYPIPKEFDNYFTEITEGKIKTKSLFN